MSLRTAIVGACPYPVPQGSQVYLRETAHALALAGHDVRIVTYGHGAGGDDGAFPLHRAPRLPGFRRTAAGPSLAKPLADAALVRTLRRVVRDHAIDVVCAHNYEGLLVALAAGKRPIVYFAHNLMFDELPQYFPHRMSGAWKRAGHWLDRCLPRRADAVVAPHARLAEALRGLGCAENAVHVAPPAVDVAAFTPCVAEDAVPPVLYAGNLDRYQNLPLLSEAMRFLRQDLPDARLVVASAQPCALLDAEHVAVPVFDALRAVLAQDAVVALPRVSWTGYPIKLLNAMASGHAVVACESAAHPLRHGENGLVVPDNDARAFASALLRCMTDPALRTRLGARAREDIETMHSRAAAAKALDAVLRSVCAN